MWGLPAVSQSVRRQSGQDAPEKCRHVSSVSRRCRHRCRSRTAAAARSTLSTRCVFLACYRAEPYSAPTHSVARSWPPACLPACRLLLPSSLARSCHPIRRAYPALALLPLPSGSAKSSRQSRPRGTSLVLVRPAIAMHDATCCFCYTHFAPADSRGSLGAPPAALSDASLAVARPAFTPTVVPAAVSCARV